VIQLSKKPTITIERFALVTKWFGQLIRDDLRTIIDEIHDVLACTWFHGDITKEEAVSVLMGQLQDLDDKGKKAKNGVFSCTLFLVGTCAPKSIHNLAVKRKR